MNTKAFFVFAFFLLLFVFFQFRAYEWNDTKYLANAMRNGMPEGFQFPLLYYATLPFWLAFGEIAFAILPLFYYFGGVAILCDLFNRFNIRLEFLAISFMFCSFGTWFIAEYTRDSLTWLLACAFAYWFFLSWFKQEKHYLALGTLAILGFFVRPQAILLAILFAILLLKEKKVFPIIFLGIKETTDFFVLGFQELKTLIANPSLLWLGFANPLAIVSALVLIRKPDFLFLFILLFVFFVGILSSIPFLYDPFVGELSMRYGFVGVPFLLFFVSKTLNELEEKTWLRE